MQKATQVNQEYTLLPVPTEVLEEVELDAFSTIQFSISRGKLIIEPIDAEQNVLFIFGGTKCADRNTLLHFAQSAKLHNGASHCFTSASAETSL